MCIKKLFAWVLIVCVLLLCMIFAAWLIWKIKDFLLIVCLFFALLILCNYISDVCKWAWKEIKK